MTLCHLYSIALCVHAGLYLLLLPTTSTVLSLFGIWFEVKMPMWSELTCRLTVSLSIQNVNTYLILYIYIYRLVLCPISMYDVIYYMVKKRPLLCLPLSNEFGYLLSKHHLKKDFSFPFFRCYALMENEEKKEFPFHFS